MRRARVRWSEPAYVDCGINGRSGCAEYVVYRRTDSGDRRQLAVFAQLGLAVQFAASENGGGADGVAVANRDAVAGVPVHGARRLTATQMADIAYRDAVRAGIPVELVAGGYVPEGWR